MDSENRERQPSNALGSSGERLLFEANEQQPKSVETEPHLPEFLRIKRTVRIAVTGDVFVTKLENDIIDEPDFQRLRGVRQLGTVFHVYPTALHTRFDHSLGTLAMVERMLHAIQNNTHNKPEERRIDPHQVAIARLYGLLHDVTHVPFGHTIEDELGLFPRHDHNMKRINRLLGEKSPIGGLIQQQLGEDVYRRFFVVYTWDGVNKAIGDDAFIYDLVSNTVCADLLDYLARDNYFCNLSGVLEYRFLKFLYLRTDQGHRRVFVRIGKAKDGKSELRRDTLTDLTHLLEARYLLAERVYFHHAKINSGAMLGRALQEAQISGSLTEDSLLEHSDDTLLRTLASLHQNEVSSRLAKALIERRLHKLLHNYTEGEIRTAQQNDTEHNAIEMALAHVAEPEDRRSFENRVADEIDAHHGDVLIYAPYDREKKTKDDMNMKAAEMKVLWEGRPLALKDMQDTVVEPRLRATLDAHRLLWGIRVIVSPSLKLEQQVLVKETCDLEFTCPHAAKNGKTHEYYEHLIDRRLTRDKIPIPSDANRYQTVKRAAVAELLQTASDRQPWSVRIDTVVKRHFARTATT